MITDKKSSIQLKNISLLALNFNLGKFKEGMEIKISIGTESINNTDKTNFFDSIVKVILWNPEISDFKFDIRMKGEFEIIGVSELELDDFLNINAPAIIFPYIRQLVRHITLEANTVPFILPIIDFVALHQAKLKNKNNQDR